MRIDDLMNQTAGGATPTETLRVEVGGRDLCWLRAVVEGTDVTAAELAARMLAERIRQYRGERPWWQRWLPTSAN